MSETIHIEPLRDLKPHIMSEACKCEPRVEVLENGNRLVVHNAYDGREFYENDEALEMSGH